LQTSWFNLASRTAIARLGAKEEGITRNHVRHRDGTLRDTVNFSIIDAEWAAVKQNLIGRLGRYA
jgi:RimJ/RimL family protein N-acetyltransferase